MVYLDVLKDDKTKKQYLIVIDDYRTYLVKELTTNKGKMDISHDAGGTTVFL